MQYERLASAATKTVLATVVDVKGSSYRLPGARMLIAENGEMFGTVSGGCLEADVLERAQKVLQTGAPHVFTYDTTAREDSVFSLNMGCRGVMRVLLERPNETLIDFFRTVKKTRRSGLVATCIERNEKSKNHCRAGHRLLFDGEKMAATDFDPQTTAKILPACAAAISGKHSTHFINENGEFYLEYIAPPVSLVIFGAGFDAVPLSETAKALGWRVAVVDHRAAYADEKRFPRADQIIVTRPEHLPENLSMDETAVAVVMTHNYAHDKEILRFLLNKNLRYVGALGPRRRTENILAELSAAGASFSAEQLENLHAPVGLDIGADTPETIALAVVAEIKSVLSQRRGGFLRERKGSIY